MKKKIRRAGIVVKPHAKGIEKILRSLIQYLKAKRITPVLEDVAARKLLLKGGLSRDELPGQVDLVIVLGGDGTLLSVAHLAAVERVPVVGVNLGRLGFLTEVPIDELFITLDAFLAGHQGIVSPRLLLKATSRGKTYLCLNDVVINKGAMARMIQISLQIDGREIAALKSDGLIVATPTGSTAYSLAAGGPVIDPESRAIILTPICPQKLSQRALVVPADRVIEIVLPELRGEAVMLTADGQEGIALQAGDVIQVREAGVSARFVALPDSTFYSRLRSKLGWDSYR